jgi:predicted lipoprotein with Yx(FWY)xxD motif
MLTRIRVALAVVALALVAAVLTVGIGAASGGRKATVALHTTALGHVLVDARGRTLYLFEGDKGRTSACYGSCAGFWPPVLVKAKPTAGSGVKRSLLGVTMRKGGAHQLTYAGHPLYRFALDEKAGQAKGEGLDDFGGHWYVLGAGGAKIEPEDAPAAHGSTTTDTTPGYGGGY